MIFKSLNALSDPVNLPVLLLPRGHRRPLLEHVFIANLQGGAFHAATLKWKFMLWLLRPSQAPGTTDTATPYKVPRSGSQVVISVRFKRDFLDVLGEYRPRSRCVRADDPANVLHMANNKATNIAELNSQRIGLGFKELCGYFINLAFTSNEGRSQ